MSKLIGSWIPSGFTFVIQVLIWAISSSVKVGFWVMIICSELKVNALYICCPKSWREGSNVSMLFLNSIYLLRFWEQLIFAHVCFLVLEMQLRWLHFCTSLRVIRGEPHESHSNKHLLQWGMELLIEGGYLLSNFVLPQERQILLRWTTLPSKWEVAVAVSIPMYIKNVDWNRINAKLT